MFKYEEILIYYFSGTGNAHFAAKMIKDKAVEFGIATHIQNISDSCNLKYPITPTTLIGFCYPTHGFNAPPIILKFLKSFPKGSSNVFLLNTRAGMKLWKLHTPGVGGIALWLPALFLIFKGYKLIGFRPLDMPSNWISLHPGLRQKVVHSIIQHCSHTITEFTHKIITGKLVLNGLLWLPLDIILIPISLGYYVYGRFAIAKTFFANYKCTNCGLCIKQCPVTAIKKKSNRPYWTFKCESCMKCMNNCPQRAIETAHGFTVLLWWVAFSIIPLSIIKALNNFQIISDNFYHDYFKILLYGSIAVFGLVIVFYGYKLLHWFLGYKLLNRLITYTSLTHYKFWRRYKIPCSQSHAHLQAPMCHRTNQRLAKELPPPQPK